MVLKGGTPWNKGKKMGQSPKKGKTYDQLYGIDRALIKRNISFQSQKTIFGRPDIFIEPNICIFVDGDYWHANPNKYSATTVISRQHNKCAKDIWKRDWEVTKKLTEQNYFVLRFWETDINNNIKNIGKQIKLLLVNTNEL